MMTLFGPFPGRHFIEPICYDAMLSFGYFPRQHLSKFLENAMKIYNWNRTENFSVHCKLYLWMIANVYRGGGVPDVASGLFIYQ